MATVVSNQMFRLTISRIAAHRKLAAISGFSQSNFLSSLGSNDNSGNEDSSNSKPEDARRKLQRLLMEVRNRKKPEEIAIDNKVDKAPRLKKVKLAKPRLRNIADESDSKNLSGIDPEIVHAVHRVATSTVSVNKDNSDYCPELDEDKRQVKVQKIESTLLKRLKKINVETEEAKEKSDVKARKDLSSLFGSIKLEKDAKEPAKMNTTAKYGETRINNNNNISRPRREGPHSENSDLTADQLAFLEKRRRLRREQKVKEDQLNYVPIDLFNSEPPLGIFSKKSEKTEKTHIELKTWNKCKEREMNILSTPSPKNFLDEMAVMTEKGILWQFPINNEQGINENEMEPFHAHVFWEHHLEPWCPKKGPIRHFMELVCVGLSKNPYISAEKKVEHILWYKDYFEKPEHNEILRVSGAIE